MISFRTTNYSVNDFVSWEQRGELQLQPKFQRRAVWSTKATSHLIDTMLRGLPVPIIFLREQVDPSKRRTVREVVDGQQRLRSVFSYVNDGFAVLPAQNPSFGGCRFSALPRDAQTSFLGFQFSVVVLEGATDAVVLDVFARLNTYAQILNRQELLNAQYFGEFKQAVYALGYEHLEYWRTNGILSDRQIVRMGEAQLTTYLVVTMLAGIQHRRSHIAEMYEANDDRFRERRRTEKEFRSVVDAINACFGDGLRDTIYTQRALFPSLFTAFYHALYGVPNTPELGPSKRLRAFSRGQLARIRTALMQLDSEYKTSPRDPRITEFYQASRVATNDRESRVRRARTILEWIMQALRSQKG
jgi:hypothetical protein